MTNALRTRRWRAGVAGIAVTAMCGVAMAAIHRPSNQTNINYCVDVTVTRHINTASEPRPAVNSRGNRQQRC